MPKQRFLIVHQKRSIGGSETYINQLAKELQRVGHDVRFLVLEGEKAKNIAQQVTNPKNQTLIWSINSRRFSLWALLLSWFVRKKNVFIVYGFWNKEARLNAEVKGGNFLQKTLEKVRESILFCEEFLVYFFSDAIVHLSEYGKKVFYSLPLFSIFKKKKQTVIYGGADTAIFHSLHSQEQKKLRAATGMPQSDFILLMVGRVQRRKNYIEGLYLLKELREKHKLKNVFLYWAISVGPYNDQKYFDEVLQVAKDLKINQYLKIVSGLEGKELAAFFQISDVFLMLSSQLETFGLVTLEALACGCPVFGYNTSATSEILGEVSKEYLAKLGKNRELAEKVFRYYRLNEKQKTLLRKMRVRSASQFSWKRSTRLLLEALH
jgi:glycosyltransferase involved in cell wall biosynthesis